MNLNTWKQIRHQTACCFEQSCDALFELVDALCSEPAARSLPELSLSPLFRRKWPSVYEALEDGVINERRWSEIWTRALLQERPGPVWVSVDSTSIARPEAETSPDRGIIYLPNLPHAKRPVSVGWQFSTIMLLPTTPSSWGAILSQRRIPGTETAISVAMEQLEELLPLLPACRRLLADRWYPTGPFVVACQRLSLDALLRLKRNRKLYRQAPPPEAGKRGAPRKDGDVFQGTQPDTWGEPDASWEGRDHRDKPIRVQAWQHLHFRQAREVELTVYRVLRMGAKETRRDPRESWFIWRGQDPLPLEDLVDCYQRRFSHEHTYRFLKQDLLWTKAHVRTAPQFERWSLVVATAMNQLVLGQSLGQASYRPWEQRRERVTPRQVRRIMPAILLQLGTPAHMPKPRGKSPGWPKGSPRRRSPRFEILKKPKPVPKTHRTRV